LSHDRSSSGLPALAPFPHAFLLSASLALMVGSCAESRPDARHPDLDYARDALDQGMIPFAVTLLEPLCKAEDDVLRAEALSLMVPCLFTLGEFERARKLVDEQEATRAASCTDASWPTYWRARVDLECALALNPASPERRVLAAKAREGLDRVLCHCRDETMLREAVYFLGRALDAEVGSSRVRSTPKIGTLHIASRIRTARASRPWLCAIGAFVCGAAVGMSVAVGWVYVRRRLHSRIKETRV
jgi:hypothetical protein